MTPTRIGDICTIAPSKSELKGYHFKDDTLVSFLPMEDLTVGLKNVIPVQKKSVKDVVGSYTFFAEGDILLAKVTPCFENGKLGIATNLQNGVGFGSSELIVIRPNLQRVIPAYLYYRLQDQRFKKDGRSVMMGACGLKRLPKSFVADTCIYLPSLSEQQRIVDVLDREFTIIDSLKESVSKNLENSVAFYRKSLQKALKPKEGWKEYSLEDACLESGQYGMSVPSTTYNGIRYLRITDITDDGNLNREIVSADIDSIDKKYILQEGDVLFARTGATVGKTLVYESEMGKCSYAGYLIRYRPDPAIVLPRMLYYITHSSDYYEWVCKNQRQSTLPNISARLYNSFIFSVPSVKEQEMIIPVLDSIYLKCKELNDYYSKICILCDDLKQSLLTKAFSGRLL